MNKRGRRHEDHYVMDEPDEENESWEWGGPDFSLCTPAKRLKSCPVCEAKTLKGVQRRYRVESDCWAQWVAIDTRQEAKWLAEEGAYDHDRPRKDFRITPLWMMRDEVDKMGEWNP